MNNGDTSRHPVSSFDTIVASVISLASLAIFASRVAPGVLPGDSGEFQFVPYIWGVAHPTGYPLYTILGGLWSHALPFWNVARRMNLFSALWGAIAIGEVYLLTVMLTRGAYRHGGGERSHRNHQDRLHAPMLTSWIGGIAAAYVLLFSPLFQRESMVAEVYSMHAAILAALLLALVAWLEHGDRRFAFWSMLLLGLGLAHHRTVLLLLPGMAMAALAASYRWRRKALPESWPKAIAALLAPLAFYLYIPLRAPHLSYLRVDLGSAGSWRLYEPTLAGFLRFVSGARFSGNLLAPADALRRMPTAWHILLAQVGIGGMILACLGAIFLLARREWASASLLIVGLASFLGFNLFYGIGDIRDFYGPPMVFVAAMAGYGLNRAADIPGKAWTRAACIAAAAAILVAFHPPALLDYHGHDETARRWETLLSLPLPENSVMVTNDRDEMVPLYYYQLVEHRRTRWQPLYPLIVPSKEWDDVAKVFRKALRSGRPVYTIKKMNQMSVAFDMVDGPGSTQKVLPMRLPTGMERLHLDFGGLLELVGVSVRDGGGKLHVDAYWRVLGKLEPKTVAYVHLLNRKGKKVSQGEDYMPGYPYYPPGLWQPGEIVRVSREVPFAGPSDCGFLLMGWYTKAHQLSRPIRVKLKGDELCRKK